MTTCFNVSLRKHYKLRIDDNEFPQIKDMSQDELNAFAKKMIIDADLCGSVDDILADDPEMELEADDIDFGYIYTFSVE